MIDALFELATRIEESPIGLAIAESRYAFFFIEGVHLIGLAIAVGLIAFIDLRLMGLILKGVPAKTVVRTLRPWVAAGFAIIMVSGGLLFWAAAARVLDSPAFALKMALIVVAGLNALWFEFIVAKRSPPASDPLGLPPGARFAGLASLTLWTGVIVTGRLIAYLPHWT
ncbi:MAG: DUF6644 family protein [Steroidobacteraceae bacterium]